MNKTLRVGIVGVTGVMGGALARGLKAAAGHFELWGAARTESARVEAAKALDIPVVTDPGTKLAGTDVLVVAVKPKDVRGVCERATAAGTLPAGAVVVSIAAGVSLADLEAAVGSGWPVARALANTAIGVGHGLTSVSVGEGADEHAAVVRTVFGAVGRCVQVPEAQMNAATAVGASGPAFVFVLIEAMIDAAVKLGLRRAAAREMALQCFAGAAETARLTGRHPAVLRDEVTTPGGCTIAGLAKLEAGGARAAIAAAVDEAARVAGVLGRS